MLRHREPTRPLDELHMAVPGRKWARSQLTGLFFLPYAAGRCRMISSTSSLIRAVSYVWVSTILIAFHRAATSAFFCAIIPRATATPSASDHPRAAAIRSSFTDPFLIWRPTSADTGKLEKRPPCPQGRLRGERLTTDLHRRGVGSKKWERLTTDQEAGCVDAREPQGLTRASSSGRPSLCPRATKARSLTGIINEADLANAVAKRFNSNGKEQAKTEGLPADASRPAR